MTDAHVVVVTGMSGAGRSTAAKVLEDVGYFVVDNLPADLIVDVVDRVGVAEGVRSEFAVVVDTRGRVTHYQLDHAVAGLRQRGLRATVLFLDASDEVLVRRFEESRRRHPTDAATLAEAIAAERKSFEAIRGDADIIIDTTDLNVHELRDRMRSAFAGAAPERRMRVDVTSFGFKRGVPRVVDLLFDARFLPNPHWVPELRDLTGLDASVRDYVFSHDDAVAFLARVNDLIDFLLPRYEAEGKSYLTVGVGCTGGKHRSVALSEALGEHLRERDIDVTIHHRDAGLSSDEAHRH
jgi:UPF0042 nucleotide-binding protein